jgi:hypothetical protein
MVQVGSQKHTKMFKLFISLTTKFYLIFHGWLPLWLHHKLDKTGTGSMFAIEDIDLWQVTWPNQPPLNFLTDS